MGKQGATMQEITHVRQATRGTEMVTDNFSHVGRSRIMPIIGSRTFGSKTFGSKTFGSRTSRPS
ncbi:hypothetical protein M446_5665 [Methylobacterium sp. 4-46]|nr:hypothetical protein M446_5665 [Methylobacterium sp. 4-46]